VQKLVAYALLKSDHACNGTPPTFGPSSVSAHVALAQAAGAGILSDLFGAAPELALSIDPTIAACQGTVLKAMEKCEDVRLNLFNKCKKEGLKRGFVTNEAELQATCLGTGTTQPDPTGGKIAKLCTDGPSASFASRCTGVNVALAFPGCAAATPAGVAACFDSRIRCRVCNLLNSVDGLARDCDVFDDGNDANQSCPEPTTCGDGQIDGAETCDDGGTAGGDGCSPLCTVEPGWTCTGSPSVCTPICGDGLVRGNEGCDDGGTTSGNGCSATCQVEPGYSCIGSPSVCTTGCGDGVIAGSETCDDHNLVSGDGCSATCQLESGWSCSGQPTTCHTICGDGLIRGGETCDDHGTTSGDGCDSTCHLETGWLCSGAPSVCHTICGDGLVLGPEQCDDGGTTSGNGCAANCMIETGWTCGGSPSVCSPICGDGLKRGLEACDDGGTVSGDGCDGNCALELGWACSGQPSVCAPICGDGIVAGNEACDDGAIGSGDGCSTVCQVETGWQCDGEPSTCLPICGDGLLKSDEECDDHNLIVGDGCSPSCRIEPGYTCVGTPSVCTPFTVVITAPTHGVFTTNSTATVTGFTTNLAPAQSFLSINGVQVPVAANHTFTTTVPLDATRIFNPIRATLTDLVHGSSAYARVVVIRGLSVANGAYSPKSVAMRLRDTGLNQVEPLVAGEASAGLNLGALLPPGTVVVDNECFIDSFAGCLGRGTVTIESPAPSYGSFGINADSMTNFVEGDITVSNIVVHLFIHGSGLVPDCPMTLTATAATFDGPYGLEPSTIDPSFIDVNQLQDLTVGFSGFQHQFDGGLCTAPVIGDIIDSFLPDIESLTKNALANFLKDPDGAGPQDSPTAAGIQTALDGITIAGPIGNALGVTLQTPLWEVAEDTDGITFGSDSRFLVTVGTGPGQCVPPAGAPHLTASYAVNEGIPSFGTTTPFFHLPYHLAISISTEGFDQLLRSQTECGLLVTSMSSIDLGTGPTPITAGLLALLMPEFGVYPPSTPFRIDIRPTIAPIIVGTPGPNNELAILKISHLLISLVQNDGSNAIALQGAVDADIPLNMQFAAGALNFQLVTPSTDAITVAVISNPLGVDTFTLETAILPPVVTQLIPSLAGSLGSFPLPSFLGLSLSGVEVSRTGEFLTLYVNLTPGP
jgi:cysteine-rich repeat protein